MSLVPSESQLTLPTVTPLAQTGTSYRQVRAPKSRCTHLFVDRANPPSISQSSNKSKQSQSALAINQLPKRMDVSDSLRL